MRRLIPAVLLAVLAVPASAHAGFFPAEIIDGPAPDLVRVADMDISRDGTGGVLYLKREAGVPHVFFSGLVDGAFQPPIRMDGGLALPSTEAVIGASSNNRMAIAFVNDGNLFTSIKAKDATGWSAPIMIAQGGVSHPSIDISINGATYVSYTQSADIRVARAERDNPAFTVVPAVLDVGPPQPAGNSAAKASKVDVSADGTAVVVWGEDGTDGRTHVFSRRMFELRPSAAPQDLTVSDVGGSPATDADSPDIDTEDDSSYAQVVFRQNTAAGPRMLMRRLVGTTFDPPVQVDGGLPAASGRVELTGRGEGLFATSGAGNQVFAGTIFNNKISGQSRLDPGNALVPLAVPALGENEDGAVTWMQGTSTADASVRARYFEGVEFLKLQPEATLSNPALGPVWAEGGMDADASRAGDVAAVFMQGGEADRRLVAGVYDKPPTRIAGANSQKIRKLTRLAWSASLNLFGGTKYRVIVDGKQIAETAETALPIAPGQVPDGEHTWQLQIVDRRGQTVVSRSRKLRVDNTPPSLRVGLSKRGRMLTVSAKGGDPDGKLPSGLARILVDFGDGELVPARRTISKRYAKSGRFTVRVKAVDKAGNETVQRRRVTIGK